MFNIENFWFVKLEKRLKKVLELGRVWSGSEQNTETGDLNTLIIAKTIIVKVKSTILTNQNSK